MEEHRVDPELDDDELLDLIENSPGAVPIERAGFPSTKVHGGDIAEVEVNGLTGLTRQDTQQAQEPQQSGQEDSNLKFKRNLQGPSLDVEPELDDEDLLALCETQVQDGERHPRNRAAPAGHDISNLGEVEEPELDDDDLLALCETEVQDGPGLPEVAAVMVGPPAALQSDGHEPELDDDELLALIGGETDDSVIAPRVPKASAGPRSDIMDRLDRQVGRPGSSSLPSTSAHHTQHEDIDDDIDDMMEAARDYERQQMLEPYVGGQAQGPQPGGAKGGTAGMKRPAGNLAVDVASAHEGLAFDEDLIEVLDQEILMADGFPASTTKEGTGHLTGTHVAKRARVSGDPHHSMSRCPTPRYQPCPPPSPPVKFITQVKGDFVTVTGSGGQRVYCSVRPNALPLPGGTTANRVAGPPRGGLLQENIHVLMQKVEDAEVKAAMAESRRMDREAKRQARMDVDLNRAALEASGAVIADKSDSVDDDEEDVEHRLWVDKYAPRSFTRLLSDEWVNREVAKWVKAWDPLVKGGTHNNGSGAPQAGGKPWDVRSPPSVHGGGRGRASSHWTRNRGQGPASNRTRDGAPAPAILLCGPPGLGKTTLAHVVARHCGYRPVEINASDDRTASTLVRRLQDAAQMQAVLGERKPNLIILDEVDGAAGGNEAHSAVVAVVQLLTAGKDEKNKGAEEGATKKKRKGPTPLNRPVICICNDLYAPALRPLREVARVFHFRAPSQDKLTERLRDICKAEGVMVDTKALHLLINRTDSDIRACLHALQFLSRRLTSIKSRHVEELNLAQKDRTHGAWGLWNDLMFAGERRGTTVTDPQEQKKKAARLSSALMDFGDYDLVCWGLHENFTRLRYLDVTLSRTSNIITSLSHVDRLMSQATRKSEYHLLAYVPWLILRISFESRSPERVQLEWPKASYSTSRRLAATLGTLRSWLQGTAPGVSRMLDLRSGSLDVVPAMKLLVNPRIRALAPHLLSGEEQSLIHQLVQTMIDYGLTYSFEDSGHQGRYSHLKPLKNDEPESVPRPLPLAPAIDILHEYPQPASTLPVKLGKEVIAEAVRQMVVQAVNNEKIRRMEQARQLSHGKRWTSPPSRTHRSRTPQPTPSRNSASQMHTPQAATPQTIPSQQPPEPSRGAGKTVAALLGLRAEKRASNKDIEKDKPVDMVPSSTNDGDTGGPAVEVKKVRGNWLDAMRHRSVSSKAGPGRGAGKAVPGDPISGAAGTGSKAYDMLVLYKFNEGYTNAVKRPLMMKDWL